jgi:hypothetical protein
MAGKDKFDRKYLEPLVYGIDYLDDTGEIAAYLKSYRFLV